MLGAVHLTPKRGQLDRKLTWMQRASASPAKPSELSEAVMGRHPGAGVEPAQSFPWKANRSAGENRKDDSDRAEDPSLDPDRGLTGCPQWRLALIAVAIIPHAAPFSGLAVSLS
ncbi:hypothetical protein SKAU_G00010750 [Synaphobranchus kaupii]|uniref:Uncharacterized protein n=1 Tax=Synaphobranchus kaupii TaxID=118154 RepID=A0A9Q1GBU0_SYNKA|nr:hypothetical protein SKAU_G00010750 [Synaphobranchus kaupii]